MNVDINKFYVILHLVQANITIEAMPAAGEIFSVLYPKLSTVQITVWKLE